MSNILFVCNSKKDLLCISPIVSVLVKNISLNCSVRIAFCSYKNKLNNRTINLLKNAILIPDYHIIYKLSNVKDQLSELSLKLSLIFSVFPTDLVIIPSYHYLALSAIEIASSLKIKICILNAGNRVQYIDPIRDYRIPIDSFADLHFCYSEISVNNLKKMGLFTNETYLVENPLFESLEKLIPSINYKKTKSIVSLQNYGLASFFNTENSFNESCFEKIANLLLTIGYNHHLVMPLFKSHKNMLQLANKIASLKYVELLDEINYLKYLSLIKDAKFAITDTYNVQEECKFFNTPCINVFYLCNQYENNYSKINNNAENSLSDVLQQVNDSITGGDHGDTLDVNIQNGSLKIGNIILQYLEKQNI